MRFAFENNGWNCTLECEVRVSAPGRPDLGAGASRGRNGAVVDVPGDEDRIDRLGGDELDEVIGEGGVRIIEHVPMEGAPQVPVGGVEDPHADTVSQPTDINDGARWRSVAGLPVWGLLGAVLLVL